MHENSKALHGFTLIEMVIVIAIIGILSAMTLASFSGKRSERGIDRASQELAAALREAQSYAQAGRSTNANEDNCSYGVQIASATAYHIVNNFRVAGACTGLGTIVSYRLKEGAGFTSGATTIGFTLPRGEVTRGGTPVVGSYRIDLASGTLKRYVCIYPTGRIVENGANSTCP